ncbi:class I SAM-dependent methyltransferase [Brevibacterium sp. LE-L]|uniref:class I SAM-dependent methyltransferase n=1 Tax=unclassified Brevibacterium TaxID=2614124 RepID=UPI003CF656F1
MTHSFDKDYWEGTWSGERGAMMSSGDPNPHLIDQVSELEPGTALDAGCGAGTEALWLASQGWNVTGADISDTALDTAQDRAAALGLERHIRWVRADLSAWQPETRFDLVTTHYAHPAIPQREFYDRIASWVAPGGTLLIVGHLHHDHGQSPKNHNHDEHGHTAPPVEASATAASITARFDPDEWTVMTAEESRRTILGPSGHPTTVDDVVVRLTSPASAAPAHRARA